MSMKRKKERFHLRDFKLMFASKLDVNQFVQAMQAIGQDVQNIMFSLVSLVDFLAEKKIIDRTELAAFVEAAIKKQEESRKLMAQESIEKPDGTREVITREATPEEVAAHS